MKKMEISNKLTRAFGKTKLKVKKYSPGILVVAGCIGVVGTVVSACKATTKLSAVLDEGKKNIDQLHDYVDTHGYSEEYTEQDGKKDLAIMYTQTGLQLAKLYAPAVILGTLSITAILTSNNMLRKRNVALAAAYTAVNTSFKEYRGRVVERFGKELDRELRYNIKEKEVEETVVNEDGTETTVKKTVQVADPNTIDDTSKIWYEGNPGWSKDPEFNLMYLKKQQAYANDLLKSRGYLFLNEVYEILGFPRTAAGQQIGWIYDEKNPIGDNFVDFGIYDIHDEQKVNFVNGYERSIILEFNHDGNILEYI